MFDPTAIADTYLATWNASAADRPAKLEAWAENPVYIDPLMAGSGRADIAAMMDRAADQFPGHHFELAGTPDGYGTFARFSWTLKPVDGEAVAAGTDFIRLDDDGRIAEVIGFLDGGPA